MLKTSYAEFRIYVKTVNQLRNITVRPILLCKECQRQLSTVTKNAHLYKMQIKGPRILNSPFLNNLFNSTHTLPARQNVDWLHCLSRHLATSTDKTTGSSSETPSKSSEKSNVAPQTDGKSPGRIPKGAEPTTLGAAVNDGTDAESAERKKNKLLSVIPRMRKPNPMDYSYTGNIYILPQRALTEYLLKPSDIQDLPKYTRRSPYADGSRITLYLRSDVEEVAVSKWGGFDQLNKEKAKLRNLDPSSKYDIMDLRSLLREMHAEDYVNPDDPMARTLGDSSGSSKQETKEPTFWGSGSTRVVLSAVLVNAANSLFKLIAWLYTGSHSMFSEFIHSLADTMNQIILGFGLYHSYKKPDTHHPYGYRNLRNISSLISGVGIFFFGTGLSYYHSIQGFLHPQDLGNLHWCIATLVGSFISEGATLIIAVNQVRRSCEAHGMKFMDYLIRGMDPNVNVVLLEDFAAVLGVGIAGVCISVTALTGSSFADSLGSALIGSLLGCVAAFIIHQNTTQLVGRSIPLDERQDISQLLERDRMIRSLHDIKATMMGGIVRFKAEVDFDGREITRAYLYKQDMEKLLLEAQNLKTVEDLENFMLNHGDKIIDALGAEVDRIEKSLKSKHPEVRHVDLEAL